MKLKPVVQLYTSINCSLCETLKESLLKLQTKDNFDIVQIDIKEKANKKWNLKYHADIPVLHIDDVFVLKHKMDLGIFGKALSK